MSEDLAMSRTALLKAFPTIAARSKTFDGSMCHRLPYYSRKIGAADTGLQHELRIRQSIFGILYGPRVGMMTKMHESVVQRRSCRVKAGSNW